MGTTSTDSLSVRSRRKQFLVDRPFQLSVVLALIIAANLAVVTAIGALFILPDASNMPTISGQRLRSIIVWTTAGYFLLTTGGIAVTTIMITHRVAGPARVIQNAIEEIRRGRFRPRLTLRKRDYLKGLASNVQELANDLRDEQDRKRSFIEACEEALNRGDQARLRELFRGMHVVGDAATKAEPASADASNAPRSA